jgi:hypothetical protein
MSGGSSCFYGIGIHDWEIFTFPTTRSDKRAYPDPITNPKANSIFRYQKSEVDQARDVSVKYILVLEDDVIFADGWLVKTLNGLYTLSHGPTARMEGQYRRTADKRAYPDPITNPKANSIFRYQKSEVDQY